MTNMYDVSDEDLMSIDLSIEDEPSNPVNESEEDNSQQPEEDTQEVNQQSNDEISQVANENTQATHDDSEQASNQSDIEENTAIDYEAFYKRLTQPFKANGKEIQITNADDMIALMQQGVNYSKRMASLKPSMGVLKTLEKHGLMDTEKLSYLIDLYEKKPEAIAKLVKDSDIDLYSFDTEQADNYVPVSKVTEVTPLEEVINDLTQNSQTFNQVLDSISSLWDNQSKQILVENPQLLRVIDNQMQSGIYTKIVNAIEYERMLGRLTDVPFLEAYRILEDKFLNANNSFTAPRPNSNKPTNNIEQKKKAINPQANANTTAHTDFNPLSVSDEELLKYMAQSQYH